jgi:hypothetical protein
MFVVSSVLPHLGLQGIVDALRTAVVARTCENER